MTGILNLLGPGVLVPLLLIACGIVPGPGPDENHIVFNVPLQLPDATVGQAYAYSFCEPDSGRSGAVCGGLTPATNPTGGRPPYSIIYGQGMHAPGINLQLNGLYAGTPTLAGTYSFNVCARDGFGTQGCGLATITVLPAVNPPVARMLTVLKEGNGTVTSDPEGIDCGSDCAHAFLDGDDVTLTETPASGSPFSGWSGDCSGLDSECQLTMDSNKTATAKFSSNYDEHGCDMSIGQMWCEATSSCLDPTESCEEPARVTVDSADCMPRERFSWGTVATWTVDAKGTASGPVGSVLQVDGDILTDCGAWGSDCTRGSGESASAEWHIQGNGATGMAALMTAEVDPPHGTPAYAEKYASRCTE